MQHTATTHRHQRETREWATQAPALQLPRLVMLHRPRQQRVGARRCSGRNQRDPPPAPGAARAAPPRARARPAAPRGPPGAPRPWRPLAPPPPPPPRTSSASAASSEAAVGRGRAASLAAAPCTSTRVGAGPPPTTLRQLAQGRRPLTWRRSCRICVKSSRTCGASIAPPGAIISSTPNARSPCARGTMARDTSNTTCGGLNDCEVRSTTVS